MFCFNNFVNGNVMCSLDEETLKTKIGEWKEIKSSYQDMWSYSCMWDIQAEMVDIHV